MYRYLFVKWVFFLWLIGILPTSSFSQPSEAKISTLNVTSGLSGLAAKNIHIDNESKIWLETENGVNRWNGVSFVKFDLPGIPKADYGGRRGSMITFAEDDRYVYLFYKNNKVFYDTYDKTTGHFDSIPYPAMLSQPHTQFTILDRQKKPWLVEVNPDSIYLRSIFNDERIKLDIKAINIFGPEQIELGNNGIWLCDNNETLVYIDFKGKPIIFKDFLKGQSSNIPQITNVFKEDNDGQLWYSLPGRTGLYKADPSSGQIQTIAKIPNDLLVIQLWEDSHGRKLIALSDELQITRQFMIAEANQDFAPWNFLATVSTIATKLVADDFFDLIYFATHQRLHVIKFNEAFLTSFLDQPDKPTSQYGTIITGISPFKDEELLIVEEGDQLFLYNDATDNAYPANKGLAKPGQFPLYLSNSNHLLTVRKSQGTNINNFVIQNLNTGITKTKLLPFNTTSTTVISHDSIVLITGEYENRTKFFVYDVIRDDMRAIEMNDFPLLSQSKINYLLYDNERSTLYISSFNNGLLQAAWHNNSLAPASKLSIPDMIDRNIISINIDNSGKLLVGSYEGLYIIDRDDSKVIRHVTTRDGLSNDVVASCIQDEHDNYWIATFSGLHVMHPRDYHVGRFQKNDGLPYEEFNRNVVYKTKRGNLLFGTGNGCLKVNPAIYNAQQPTFSILYGGSTVRTKDEDIEIDSLPTAPISMKLGDFSGIDILLGNNDWGRNDDVTYYYRVEDLDSEWNKTRENAIRIDRLPEGNHKIQIKASSRSGYWSNNSITIPIELYIPFFNKNWVRIVSVALLISSTALLYLIAYRRRARIKFEFQRRVSDLELRLLQSQMNPHFIFNALGAIQFYIFNNQKDIAENYLSKFASLMRMFLESSRNNFISLKEELKLLRGYVELEHMRFPDKFESSFNIKLEDQLDNYSVPAMLFQPFLENSINHGLFHSNESGELKIRFYDDDHSLYCEIEDNGIGRKRAREIKANSIRMYKSRSTQIIEERIEVLKEAENMHINISYDDYSPDSLL